MNPRNEKISPDTLALLLFGSSLFSLPLAFVYLDPNNVVIAPDMFRQDNDILLAQHLGAGAFLLGLCWAAAAALTAFGAAGLRLRRPGSGAVARWGQGLTLLLSLALWAMGKPLGAVFPGLLSALTLTVYLCCSDVDAETHPA